MKIEQNFSLERYNTFHLPVKTRWFMEYESEDDLQKILHDEYFHECHSLHIGEGSNLLFLNDFNGIVLHSGIRGMEEVDEDASSVVLRVGSGEHWDDVVAYAVKNGWYGIENLSGIPGEVGSAAVQNIGAYGAELAQVVASVEAYNRFSAEKVLFSREDCEYKYRYSRFKDEKKEPCYITHVNLRLQKSGTLNMEYSGLREAVGEVSNPTLASLRQAVLKLRISKLPDPSLLGNAGSFFMNPIVNKTLLLKLKESFPTMPFYPSEEGSYKLSAGWLIEQCAMKGVRHGDVGTYDKQALVIVNYGGATGDEIALFAESIRQAVNDRFGVELTPEVKYVF